MKTVVHVYSPKAMLGEVVYKVPIVSDTTESTVCLQKRCDDRPFERCARVPCYLRAKDNEKMRCAGVHTPLL